jgi:urea transport system permease protein
MMDRTIRLIRPILAALSIILPFCSALHAAEQSVAAIVADAVVEQDADKQKALLESLADLGDAQEAARLLSLWKEGSIYLYTSPDGKVTPVIFPAEADGPQELVALATGSKITGADGAVVKAASSDLELADTDSRLRKVMKSVTDRAAIASKEVKVRLQAVQNTGLEQNLEKLPLLEGRLKVETNGAVKDALVEAIALTQMKSADAKVRAAAITKLGSIGSIASQGVIKTALDEATKSGDKELAGQCERSLKQISTHISNVNAVGTVFRGLSAGSVLLVAAIGLAITFGLMGVINMAHGELIVVGAYTTYVVQNIFAKGMDLSPFGLKIHIPGMGLEGNALGYYFIAAIPASFLMAALVGVILERSIIRFLYKRPLESLLATWGVSLVIQQLFRLVFGSNNVQVESPAWLSGNWTINDVAFGWNRVFVISFAILIIFMTRAVLTKTPLGLLIRAVMQNRAMAACMGIRTERVNMLTFAFGSGLAGLAGAFLSQIGNVGPGLGQDYIVDSFMTVVVGGVGNLLGTVLSSFRSCSRCSAIR